MTINRLIGCCYESSLDPIKIVYVLRTNLTNINIKYGGKIESWKFQRNNFMRIIRQIILIIESCRRKAQWTMKCEKSTKSMERETKIIIIGKTWKFSFTLPKRSLISIFKMLDSSLSPLLFPIAFFSLEFYYSNFYFFSGWHGNSYWLTFSLSFINKSQHTDF